MTGLLDGRTAVVTGSSSGNGRAVALALAAEGAAVVCSDVQKSARPDGFEPDLDVDTDDLVVARGGQAAYLDCDVTRADDVQALVDLAVSRFGRLDVMVNNAGVFTGLHSVLDETEEQYDLTMAVNAKGVWLGCRAAARQMTQQDLLGGVRGRIVNIASVGGVLGLPYEPAYCASKGAVVNLTRQLALDLGPWHVAVNVVCPGFITTGMMRSAVETPEIIEATDRSYPWADRGVPEDVARAVVHLASDASSYVHGAVISVDGGMSSGVYAGP